MKVGIGGAPMRASTLPTDPAERKKYPLYSGLFEYFPDALCAVARVSWQGNEQHNPGQPLNWNRSKSADEGDTMLRHLSQAGEVDTDGQRHTAKAAWRVLAMLQKEMENSINLEEAIARLEEFEAIEDAKQDYSREAALCGADGPNWYCTRPKGHTGLHCGHFSNGVPCTPDPTWA